MAKRKKSDRFTETSQRREQNEHERRAEKKQQQRQQWHTQQSTINSSALKLSFFHWRIYIPTHLLEMYNKRIAIRSYVHLIQCCAVEQCFCCFVLVCVGDGGIAAADTELNFFFRKRRPTEKNCTQNKMRKKSLLLLSFMWARSRCANSKPPDE